jgi:hypothetical protein
MSKNRTAAVKRGRKTTMIYSWDQPEFTVRVRPKSALSTNRTVSSLQRKMSSIAAQRKRDKGEVWKTRMTKTAVHLTRVA